MQWRPVWHGLCLGFQIRAFTLLLELFVQLDTIYFYASEILAVPILAHVLHLFLVKTILALLALVLGLNRLVNVINIFIRNFGMVLGPSLLVFPDKELS